MSDDFEITLTLNVDDPADRDSMHDTGLTGTAYDRLVHAMSAAGFSIADGPDFEPAIPS